MMANGIQYTVYMSMVNHFEMFSMNGTYQLYLLFSSLEVVSYLNFDPTEPNSEPRNLRGRNEENEKFGSVCSGWLGFVGRVQMFPKFGQC